MDIYLTKKSHDSLVFRVNTNNFKHPKSKKMCARFVFTEQTSMLAEAHKQRPTNTHCTYAHTQTKKHSTTLPASFFTPVYCQQSDHRAVGCTLLWKSTLLIVIVHICNRKVQTMFHVSLWNAAKVSPEGFFFKRLFLVFVFMYFAALCPQKLELRENKS